MKGLTDWQHTTYTLRAMYGDGWRMDAWWNGAATDLEATATAVDDAIDARRGAGRGDR